jgi:muconolactone delta-isomerase
MGFDFVEEHIRLAQERGDFDNLPGAGRPIESLERGYDPNWWARDFMERLRAEDTERSRSAGLEGKLATVWGLTTETRVRAAVADLNAEAASDMFDADEVVATWRKFRASIRPR